MSIHATHNVEEEAHCYVAPATHMLAITVTLSVMSLRVSVCDLCQHTFTSWLLRVIPVLVLPGDLIKA